MTSGKVPKRSVISKPSYFRSIPQKTRQHTEYDLERQTIMEGLQTDISYDYHNNIVCCFAFGLNYGTSVNGHHWRQ